ncbi:MAG: zinc-ribbon domain-containing protein [Smithella sp.]
MSRLCTQCKAKVEEDSTFCPQCGAKQGDSTIGQANREFVPTMEISRESGFVGCLLSFRVFVDGAEIGRLKNGEKKRFQLAPGLHELYIKVNWSWFSSPKESFLLKDFAKISCKPKIGLLGAAIKIPFYSLFKRHQFVAVKIS